MKTSRFYVFLLVILGLVVPQWACELSLEDDADSNSLTVLFENGSDSQYTITGIQLRPRGSMTNLTVPTTTWTPNILNDRSLAPGETIMLDLEIPNREWSQYKLTVVDGNGTSVVVAPSDEATNEMSISHWGSDQRTVSVSVKYNTVLKTIYVSGWSDFAGI
ncbi:MAG: hypothetical protein RIS47_1666 [Bacteroidota bacterium]|jgi:hypothetical protein